MGKKILIKKRGLQKVLLLPNGEFTILDDPVVNVIKSKIPAAAAEINIDT